ncbi:MAG: hypothetical protein KDA57_21815 [Planctomycetales bacterium]|nr:hypothetical protein [Planctomycetales bacterium]
MRRVKGSALLVVAVFSVTGCSGYRTGVLPNSEIHASEKSAAVQVGQRARITLVSGRVVEGQVQRVSSEEIVVGKVGNYGFEEYSVAADEISVLEVEGGSSGDKAIGMAGLIVVAGIGLLLVAVSTIDVPSD